VRLLVYECVETPNKIRWLQNIFTLNLVLKAVYKNEVIFI
jgi:hypothetical protein